MRCWAATLFLPVKFPPSSLQGNLRPVPISPSPLKSSISGLPSQSRKAINHNGLIYNGSMRFDGHSILVLDASPFGRSLDLVPSINAIRAAYPATHIAVAASSGICELLSLLRLADRTVSLGPIKPSDKGLGSALLRLFRLSRSLGGQELDLVLDFSPAVPTLVYGLTRRARIITPTVRRERLTDRRRPGSTAARNSAAKTAAAASPYENVLDQLDLNSDLSKWIHVPFPHESSRFEESLSRSGS